MDLIYEEKIEKGEHNTNAAYVCHIQNCLQSELCALPHTHEYIEVLYATKGSFDIWLNGKYFSFSEGDLVVINSHEIHSISSHGVGTYMVIRFLPEIIHSAGNSVFEAKYITPFIINNSKHQRVFKEEEISKTSIPEQIFDILEEYRKKEFGYELSIRTSICSIFLWILRYWNKKNVDLALDTSINNDLFFKIQEVMDYVSNNYQEEISVNDASRMCNISYSYFSRIFKQITKHSFSEYLNYIRITEAEKLLVSTDLSMTEIAMRTGFSTSSYFIQQFKLRKFISPKQFRKNILSK